MDAGAAGTLAVSRPSPSLSQDIEWRHARLWVGRRLVLRNRWLDFEAGTPCRVMCGVDFGDGLLYWITTDDAAHREVDQVTRRELEKHFHVDGGPVALDRSRKRGRTQQKEPCGIDTRPSLRVLPAKL